MRLKRGVYSFVIILIIVGVFIFSVTLYDHFKVNKIQSQYDTRFVPFNKAKNIALDFLEIFNIENQEQYTILREKFKDILTESLWHEYFSNDIIPAGYKKQIAFDKNIVGAIISPTEFVFKVEGRLYTAFGKTPIILLVFINENLVYKVQSLR